MAARKYRKKKTSPRSLSPTTTLQSQLEVHLPQFFLHGLILLQNLYISRLDASLIASIASESASLDEAKAILEPLAQASVSEEEFQAGITYGDKSVSSLSEESEYVKVADLSEDEVFQFLRITFPKPADQELRAVIEASGGDMRKAMDVLLNHEYLRGIEEKLSYAVPAKKDIEEEDEESIWAQKRPGDISRPKTTSTLRTPVFPALGTPSPQQSPLNSRSQSPFRSRWDALDSQILFLAQSLSLPTSRVRSAFHANASSLPKALRELLRDIPEGRTDEDIVANLRSTFKNVDISLLRKVVYGTKHDLDTAMELARILDHDKTYHSIRTISAPSSSTKFTLNLAAPPTANGLHAPPRMVDDGEGTYDQIMELRKWYLEKRNEAFTASQQAYRTSKSDNLMSGAAAYYATLGRDYDIKYRHYAQISANRLVAQNSSKNSLDLHGVGVRDAVRIVEEGVTNWWTRVEVQRDRGEIRGVESFVIITGRGERYLGGGKLGPAVTGWLRRNGWGFEEEHGKIVVWGTRKVQGVVKKV
jgi:Smr domain